MRFKSERIEIMLKTIKTSELTGADLDRAVAKCMGQENCWMHDYKLGYPVSISTDWAQGGPIIEREKIAVMHIADRQAHQQWAAGEHDDEYTDRFWEVVCGPTPLIAAMRCYVASKLGDEVEIPEELK